MRSDQFMGLPPKAVDFLKENEVPEEKCSHCKRPIPRQLQRMGTFHGMFGDEYPLYQHLLTNRLFAEEFVQEAPWGSGPCFFSGLRIPGNVTLKWSQSEIDEEML